MDGCGKPQPKTKRPLCRRSALRHSDFLQLTPCFLQLTAPIIEQSGVRTLLHAILLEAVLLPLAHSWGGWYNTLDGLIYGTFILAAKGMWHLIDFGQSFYMAAALNEQIRKRKREEIQKESTNNG